MGVAETPYWLSWLVFFTAGVTVISIACAAILAFAVFKYTQFLPLIIFFWLYGMSLFGYIMLIQSFFSQSVTLAAVVSTLVFFITSFIDFLVSSTSMPEHFVMLASILPTVNIRRALTVITNLENQRRGFTFETNNEVVYNFRMQTCFLMFVYAFFILGGLGIYFSQILSSGGGLRKHVCFCIGLRPKARQSKPGSKPDLPQPNALDFEAVSNVKLLNQEKNGAFLQIRDLVKTFDTDKTVVHAVNGLDVKMYSGQIFALLGHNGAGKTTTIQMLTGMLEPSSGLMQFLGLDLVSERELLQAKIGVCPQDNVLFDLLSVYEHFQLFQSLKNAEGGKQAIEQLITDLELAEYRDTLAKDLSGGNKRKLQVGLALIGDSRLVLLDEPTAGLDIEARRRLWDLLIRYKQDRVVILTTHYMDEADLLGDRIGIMSEGRLICCGSSLFLKNRFQVGTKLIIQQAANDASKLEEFLSDLEPSIKLISQYQNNKLEAGTDQTRVIEHVF